MQINDSAETSSLLCVGLGPGMYVHPLMDELPLFVGRRCVSLCFPSSLYALRLCWEGGSVSSTWEEKLRVEMWERELRQCVSGGTLL